ncbi:MAG: Isoquinoline 1-oxidoreductase, partial [Rhizobacter sp.]|nr:Isoquinoline 1-oxidoreductase [Rhizobacter sp.]
QAMRELKVRWKPWPGLRQLDDLEHAIRNNPSTRRLLTEQGDVDAAMANAAVPMPRTYVWPYQLHASIGPSCALADWRGDTMTVWAGTQNPHVLRADLSRLMAMSDTAIDLVRMEAAGCYGRNCADDVAADAALLSRAVGKPVRVQLSREQENAWDPKGAAQLMQVNGGLNADGSVAAYDFQTSYPSNGAPTLALLLTGTVAATSTAYEMGDRTAVPPYAYDPLRVVANDMAPILRASWLRGVSALPNSFAHESYVDELATQAGVDPVAFRLDRLKDVRAAELLRATADKAGWLPHTLPQQQPADGPFLKGQGVAYARYVHSKFPGFGAAWAAWVADVEVNRNTGEVHVSRVVVGHDAGLMVNPAGVQHQIHGNVLQTTSRALKEQVSIDERGAPVSLEWGAYPILSFREVPVVEVMMMPRPGEPPMGAGESSSVPGTAAIANAIFDATGVRFRQPPFTPEVVKAALAEKAAAQGRARLEAGDVSVEPVGVSVLAVGGEQAKVSAALLSVGSPVLASSADAVPASGAQTDAQADRQADERAERQTEGEAERQAAASAIARTESSMATASWPRRKAWWALAGALAGGLVGVAAAVFGWRAAIAPVVASSARVYTADTIERGRQLAAAGDCIVCHTAPGGVPNAGGRAMETPVGVIYSTNLTPDAQTGIGSWSFSAFQRAMREGISRDGHHLYPAFPYTAFTQTTDDDLTALYGYLMAQPAVRAEVPATQLVFPFSVRPLMALWNAVNLQPGPAAADPRQSAEWNRGAYLVNGLGHCGACHTPRDAMQAEQTGRQYLSGAVIDGWEAPPLTALSQAPVPWTQAELYRYLRFGHSAQHGVASGPMGPVVQQLGQLPEADVQAMATYLASFNGQADARVAGGADTVAKHQSKAAEPRSEAKGDAGAAVTPDASTARAETAVAAATAAALADAAIARSQASSATLRDASQRLFDSACGACHHDGNGPMLLGL